MSNKWFFCIKVGCRASLKMWEDLKLGGYWFQHGDNREARLFVPYKIIAANDPEEHTIRDWLGSVHMYLTRGVQVDG